MSVNKAILVGRLGRDPEIRFSTNGDPVANLALATSENWKDKNGEKQERTEWHRVVAFGKLADIIGKYLAKGAQIYVEGKIRTRKWTDNQGVEKYTTEIHADEMRMLGSKQDGAGQGAQQQRPQERQQQANEYRKQSGGSTQPADFQEPWNDDIPF